MIRYMVSSQILGLSSYPVCNHLEVNSIVILLHVVGKGNMAI